jgi:hypothetical protein
LEAESGEAVQYDRSVTPFLEAMIVATCFE